MRQGFIPTASKFKKYQKGKYSNKIKNNVSLFFKKKKILKLIALNHGRFSSKQLITIKFLIRKNVKKKAFFVFNLFPQTVVTKKPLEIRMGKGKGSPDHWISKVKIGFVICKIYYKTGFRNKAISAFKKCQYRLPLLTKII